MSTATLPAATTVPIAAGRAARSLVEEHRCIVCRELPERPFDKGDEVPGQDYRPRKPAPIASGKTKRSFRCLRHTRAHMKAIKHAASLKQRTKRFGVPVEIQIVLWVFQGCACPCGRKASPTIPPGVTLDHDHNAPCVGRDHPADRVGCLQCVTLFLCTQCNREILGRLERSHQGDRERAGRALIRLGEAILDPPLRRLLQERPDLTKETAA